MAGRRVGDSPMPGHNAPWFRSSKNARYAPADGKQLSLGVGGKHSRKEALQAFARLITGQAREREHEPKREQKPSTDARTVRTLFNEFIAHAEADFKAWTVRTYRRFLTPFGKRHGTVKARDITGAHVESFAERPTWSDTTRHGCIKAIATAFRRGGHPPTVNAPPKASRGAEAVIPPDDFAKLEAEAEGDFRALLRFLWNRAPV